MCIVFARDFICKYIYYAITFPCRGIIVGAKTSEYLLEKSRIVSQVNISFHV